MKTSKLFKGTLILTIAGLITRLLGFYYRIFLTNYIGTEGLGLYQLVFPILGLSMAISCSGLSMCISRYSAYYTGQHSEAKARQSMLIGMILSLLIALPCTATLYFFPDIIAVNIIKEPRCAELLKFLALTIPLSVIHSSIASYYMGKCNALIPGICQLFEQIIRIASVILICKIQASLNILPSPLVGVTGLFCGELGSTLFCLTICRFSFKDLWHNQSRSLAKEMFHMSVPFSINRIILSAFHSIEAVLIPLMLRKGGVSTLESLSIYGILSGMAVPLVLLPSTLINSFSSMLLPIVSENINSDDTENVNLSSTAKNSSTSTPNTYYMNKTNTALAHNITTAYQCSLYIGILCFGAFWIWGKDAGALLFGEPLAGIYTKAFSWLCPFLYISATLSSILNGLGKTHCTLRINVISLMIRILLILYLIPRFGITGFFIAFLVSEIYLSLDSALALHRIQPVNYAVNDWIIKPLFALAIAIGSSLYIHALSQQILPFTNDLITLLISGGTLIFFYVVLLFLFLQNKKAS